METYVLTAGQPVRASAISAVIDLIAAVLIVIGVDRSNAVLIVIGAVLFLIGIALVVLGAVLRRRVRTEVRLDTDGITISAGGRTAAARWREITGVTTDRQSIYLDRDENQPVLKIDSPRGDADPQFGRLSAELAHRLDQDRGYRNL